MLTKNNRQRSFGAERTRGGEREGWEGAFSRLQLIFFFFFAGQANHFGIEFWTNGSSRRRGSESAVFVPFHLTITGVAVLFFVSLLSFNCAAWDFFFFFFSFLSFNRARWDFFFFFFPSPKVTVSQSHTVTTVRNDEGAKYFRTQTNKSKRMKIRQEVSHDN